MQERVIKFEKYQGAGNDFIVIDGRINGLEHPLEIAPKLCDRHFSIGADDVLYLERSSIATIKMRILEPDGSESNMCGNGLRSVALYLMRKEGIQDVTIESLGGIKRVVKKDNAFTVSMGKMQPLETFIFPESLEIMQEKIFDIGKFFVVSSSEPHAVTFAKDLDRIDIIKASSVSKCFDTFPKGINVDFVDLNNSTLKVRTFERGIWGETLACGTGAVASAFVAKKIFGIDNHITIEMKGGTLYVDFEGEEAFLTGPAEFVFGGSIIIKD